MRVYIYGWFVNDSWLQHLHWRSGRAVGAAFAALAQRGFRRVPEGRAPSFTLAARLPAYSPIYVYAHVCGAGHLGRRGRAERTGVGVSRQIVGASGRN